MAYWILQCNPRKFRIFDYWRDNPNLPDTWTIGRYSNEIEPGDMAFIWVSNDHRRQIERGIYAIAQVSSSPDENRQPYEQESGYWIDGVEQSGRRGLPRLEIRYIKVPLARPLLASMLARTPGLENLQIFKFAQSGVYKLADVEGRIIESLIAQIVP